MRKDIENGLGEIIWILIISIILSIPFYFCIYG